MKNIEVINSPVGREWDLHEVLRGPRFEIEVWQGIDMQWYWHIVSAFNGQVLATSEGYTQKKSAYDTILNISTDNLRLVLVKGEDKQWYWLLKNKFNHQTILTSEGYRKLWDARNIAQDVWREIEELNVIELVEGERK